MKVRLEFKRQDLWFGLFYQTTLFEPKDPELPRWLIRDVWICLIPCFPIHFQWERHGPYKLKGFLSHISPPKHWKYVKEK